MSSMKTIEYRESSSCRTMPFVALIRRVLNGCNEEALEEILSRTMFRRMNGQLECYINFAEYLEQCRQRWSGDTEQWEKAYDLTVERFYSLPRAEGKTTGVDCRFYYGALLKRIERLAKINDVVGDIELEQLAAKVFQQFVDHQFALSFKESLRTANPFISRYNWNLDEGYTLTVWMPKYIVGRERRRWLQENVSDIDPSNPGERQRVQEVINQKLEIPGLRSYDECYPGLNLSCVDEGFEQLDMDTKTDFARFVAKEKAFAIDKQRDAIQALGAESVERLVVEVFDSTEANGRPAPETAAAYGLSRSAFSRFAGSRPTSDNKPTIGDLWVNVAHILSQVPDFRAMAEKHGHLDSAERIADRTSRPRLRSELL